jgi:hypothetical protein
MMGPCPICSTDLTDASSTRWQTKGEGWVCAVCCDGGDVIALVQRALGLTFPAAVDYLGGKRSLDMTAAERRKLEKAAQQEKRDATSAQYREHERKVLYDIWRGAAQPWGTPVESYLAARGLPVPPWSPGTARLRYVADMAYFHGQTVDDLGRKSPRVIHRGSAMVAPITREGKFSGLHITYLALAGVGKASILDPDTGEVLPAKKVRGSKSGAAIELVKTLSGEPQRLVIGEGIETVLSVWHAMVACDIELCATEFWSSVDLGNFGGRASAQVTHPTLTDARGRARRVPGPEPDLAQPGIDLPGSVMEVIALGDGDSDPVTTQCALHRGAARFKALRPDRIVKAAFAPDDVDFNDMLGARK